MSVDLVAVRSHRKGFAPPVWRMMEMLTDERGRWLSCGDGELWPSILEVGPGLVVWSSLWRDRPDDQIRVEVVTSDGGQGSDLRWTLLCPAPDLPDADWVRLARRRIDQLLNGELREFVDTVG